MSFKNVLLTLFLLLSFLLWRWFDTSNEPEPQTVFDPSRPDFIAKNLYSVAYDEQGKLSYRIFADSMTHFEHQQQTLFDHPVVLVYPEDIRPIWQLTANSGILQGRLQKSQKQSLQQNKEADKAELSKHEKAALLQQPVAENLKSAPQDVLKVKLNDNVKIVNLTNNEYVKQVTTTHVELDILAKEVSTPAKVYVEGPTYDLQGRGLVGNLSTEQLELLEEVHGIYHQE